MPGAAEGPEATARRLEAYTRALYAREDALLRELRAEIPRRGWPRIAVSPALGRLLQLLLRIHGSERVVEIGALAGYSTLWMARALPAAGRLVSFELEEERGEVARRYLRRAGLDDRTEVRVADAREALPALGPDGGWDAVFIDADKESYPLYLRESARLLRPGGLLLADNAYRRGDVLDPPAGDEAIRGIREFNRRLAESGDFDGTIVPIRDGLAVGVRRA